MDNHQYAWLGEVLPGRPLRILDAGCGRGELAAELIQRGHEVTAIDASQAAVEAARSAGVPALHADLTTYEDGSLFDVIVMSLSLHHMHPLAAALDQASKFLDGEGLLVVDEFAWDWADAAAVTWFYDAGSLLASAGVAGFPRGTHDPAGRWREAHADHSPAADMLAALGERFEITGMRREPYLSRYLGGKLMNGAAEVLQELWRIERDRIAAGTLPPTGFRLTAQKT